MIDDIGEMDIAAAFETLRVIKNEEQLRRVCGAIVLSNYRRGLRRGLELAQKHARISTTAPGNPGQAVTPYVDFGGAEKAIEDEVAK